MSLKQIKNIEHYYKAVSNLIDEKKDFYVVKKRQQRKIIDANTGETIFWLNPVSEKTFKTKKEKQTYIYLCGHIKKAYNKFGIKNNNVIPSVEKLHPVAYRNHANWDQLIINDTFYYVDIKHCFWTMAYRLKIISKPVYEKYGFNKVHKKPRNMALTSCLAPETIQYFYSDNKSLSITCDSDIYRDIYKLIRYSSYNLIGEIANNKLGYENYIFYNVDAIAVINSDVDYIISKLNKKGFITSVLECKKISEFEYLKGDEGVKKF